MADAWAFRLDTIDVASEFNWRPEHTSRIDEFTKDGTRITVHYSLDDEITSVVRQRPNRDEEFFSQDSPGNNDRLRAWLTGRPSVAAAASPMELFEGLTIKFDGTNPWPPQHFLDAVEDPADHAFLRRILELMHATSQLPTMGDYCHLCFGQYPGGALFVYPSMRRYPPYKFKIARSGQLLISGCWKSNFKVTGHPGFAELASLLDLDHTGSAPWNPVSGLDADELWDVGERASRAINA
ncbi:hypothetical protein MTER_34440 [Mycolicibacter terrae]|uniref:Uncharacterized protein n=1 Tax=Mycolicibacter terrae TaxID=1788 RepID=A0AAD1I034_9MYCO|nr:hypothetical protein [Mycolicibacter terrae]BBX24033.1 hypothetical protein MTER_34440 [Mycolicibacter terrae]SNV57124.1 Uncharacterised protein [Mycolicibacter terrae]